MTCPSSGAPPAPHGPRFASDPEAAYAALRTRGPAHRVELAPGVEAVLVTDHAAALEVLRSPHFSRDPRRRTAWSEGTAPDDDPAVREPARAAGPRCTDRERHARLRSCVESALARVDASRVRDYVRRRAVELIEGFRTQGHADLVTGYADLLPAQILSRLLGCRGEAASRVAAACGRMTRAEPATARQAEAEIASHLRDLVADRRRTPGADVTSWLLHPPAALGDEETVGLLLGLVSAGAPPQAAWISSAILLLLTDDRFAQDVTGGSLTVADALNQVLWTRPPASCSGLRYAVADHVLRDGRSRQVTVPAGMPVLVAPAAVHAGTVPAVSYRTRAANRAHLAFGAGPHRCPARGTAGVIADVAVETLLDRLPDIELAVPADRLTRRPGPWERGLAELPVRFPATPAR